MFGKKKLPDLADFFCEDAQHMAVEHLRNCPKCRAAVLGAFDALPMLDMLIDRTQLERALNGTVAKTQ